MDAIVYLCLGPRANASLQDSIQFVRPRINTSIKPVTRAAAVIEISDDEDEDDDGVPHHPLVAIPEPPVLMDPAPPEHHGVKVPHWVLDILAARDPRMFLVTTHLLPAVTNVANHLEGETPLLRSKDIEGEHILTYMHHPPGRMLVPALGGHADSVVDGLGYTTSTIRLIHSTWVNARGSPHRWRKWFVNTLADHGMSLMEAAMFWQLIKVPVGNVYVWRERFVLEEAE